MTAPTFVPQQRQLLSIKVRTFLKVHCWGDSNSVSIIAKRNAPTNNPTRQRTSFNLSLATGRPTRTLATLIFSAILLTTSAFSQSTQRVDTLDYYEYKSRRGGVEDSCFINHKYYPKEMCEKISQAESIQEDYLSSIDFEHFTKNNLHFVRYKEINGTTLHTQYEVDPDLAPFGEYINYYPNGKIKSKWYFQEPNDSLTNKGIMEGNWHYFNVNGDTIGVKRYKNGLAHGKWIAMVNDTAWVEKEFKDGFSDGTWVVRRISNYSLVGRPYQYHNGFYHSIYICDEKFTTPLDEGDNVFENEKIIEIEKVEYAEKRQYIKNGKFYILKDGIKIGLKEFKNGELIKKVDYDYR